MSEIFYKRICQAQAETISQLTEQINSQEQLIKIYDEKNTIQEKLIEEYQKYIEELKSIIDDLK